MLTKLRDGARKESVNWGIKIPVTPEEKDQIIRFIRAKRRPAGSLLRELLLSAAEAEGISIEKKPVEKYEPTPAAKAAQQDLISRLKANEEKRNTEAPE